MKYKRYFNTDFKALSGFYIEPFIGAEINEGYIFEKKNIIKRQQFQEHKPVEAEKVISISSTGH